MIKVIGQQFLEPECADFEPLRPMWKDLPQIIDRPEVTKRIGPGGQNDILVFMSRFA